MPARCLPYLLGGRRSFDSTNLGVACLWSACAVAELLLPPESHPPHLKTYPF